MYSSEVTSFEFLSHIALTSFKSSQFHSRRLTTGLFSSTTVVYCRHGYVFNRVKFSNQIVLLVRTNWSNQVRKRVALIICNITSTRASERKSCLLTIPCFEYVYTSIHIFFLIFRVLFRRFLLRDCVVYLILYLIHLILDLLACPQVDWEIDELGISLHQLLQEAYQINSERVL